MEKYRASKATTENKAVNNAYMKNYRARVASSDQKAKYNGYIKTDIEFTISNFHEVIAQGPLYICTCCDQLWYKHAVLDATKLRESNSDIGEYLCNKTSIDDVEWVCKTCHSHLVKYKIPPCAVVNGMVFPQKTALFDLN